MRKRIFFVDIDTQSDFMHRRGALYVPGAESIIPRLKKLTAHAQKKDIPIIASVDTHSKKDQEFKQFPGHCIEGSLGQRKIKETLLKKRIRLKRKKYSTRFLTRALHSYPQLIIEKNTFDIFSNPSAKSLFRYADTLYVYGVATDYCVKACCLGLLKLKKDIRLVHDTVKPVDKKAGKKTLQLLRAKGVKTTTVKSLLG
ncbi:cysteine hydrolase family protein [Candidatus Omnitrophota bacterium]